MNDSMFLSGIQALVQLPMLQRRRDRAAGLNTAGLVSGYRGSPLGAYDQQLWKASKQLAEHDIVFQPGLNEDLAATALWGAQMHKAYGDTKVDGVFGIWYGKGPGVDRTGDVFRTANIIGTSALGGVLAVSGDDHAAQSSMYPHQTDGIFHAASIPVLQPANVREVMELGLAGIAMSRYCGLWVGLKTIAEVIETAATVTLDALPTWRTPELVLPVHGLNWDARLAWPAQRAELERRLIEERLPAARAWARANGIDRTIIAAPQRRFGIITVGKAHQDFMQALDDMQLSRDDLAAMGISLYKVAMSWPLETDGATAFAAGHEEVLVIEEKRANVESQLKDALYGMAVRPRITGKSDGDGAVLLPEISEFTPLIVARAVARRFGEALPVLRERLAALDAAAVPVPAAVIPVRAPYFCSGCPHNSSTKTPEGSIAGGGIGCHVMSLAQPELKTNTFSQMGGEGLQWVGAAPFSGTGHIFQNLGDGTYQHSGLLAIRAAVAAKTNITYKILYNDAVAMTGGQAAEGVIDPARITRQLHAEGVQRIVLVSDDPARWRSATDAGLAPGTEIHDRSELDAVQRMLREVPGVTAIVYEQTCAAEKRRRRKRKAMPDPDRRVFINERVCEGCGDCSVQSNCISVEPLETAYGRKRKINQNACNKDFSCVKGFCPSFVDVEGPRLRKPETERLKALEAELSAALTLPQVPQLDGPFNVVVAGIGGTGVLTTGAVLGGAAHVEGKASTVLDFTGLAQKNGAVVSQVRLAREAGQIGAVRIGQGAADLLLGADMVVAAAADNAARLSPSRSAAVLNLDETPTAQIVRQRDAIQPASLMRARIKQRCLPERFHTIHANALAQALFGDTVVVHTLMLGFAWQHGLVPLSLEAILRTIELNGAAVPLNLSAFKWGRIAACNPGLLERVRSAPAPVQIDALGLDELVATRVADLTAYQDAAYAERFRALVARAADAEQRVAPGRQDFARNVAISAYRLMAYKDEYEVARLYSSEEFRASLAAQFSDHGKLSLWLAPPLLSRIDPATGRPRKRKFGPWIFTAMRLLAGAKGLRGTAFDVFGYTEERRSERAMVAQFTQLVEQECARLDTARYEAALELARMPQEVRGYGPVKHQAMQEYQRKLLAWQQAAPAHAMPVAA
ncbi:indolepyruvate ferredoxin oxidoreductase family protein [Pseudoduganella sp. OTU4001]|uniref:indolepyruvate ferredoxin oxidoreductase family protein n=1 Tax=Pseudoduganella sp. OTU4001 TaxID=3043854 RepID=UPI00313ACD1A